MTKSEAFHVQASSDFRVFELLLAQERRRVPECHPGHYLQMATEKLAKAALQRLGNDPGNTHEAFTLLRHHLRRRDVAHALGYPNFSSFRDFLSRSAGLFERIEALHPDVPSGAGGPNVEYPWQGRDSSLTLIWHTPEAHDFPVIRELQSAPDGTRLIQVIRLLIERFEAVFPLGSTAA